jgi:hypothetical protein
MFTDVTEDRAASFFMVELCFLSLLADEESLILSILQIVGKIGPCRILCSHSGGYEEYYLLGYNAV